MIIINAARKVTYSPWEAWDETSESVLASDYTFVCLFENPSAGGDETGQGLGLSGSDLVLTQSGNVAGATGSPPYRSLDGSDDYFTATDNLFLQIGPGDYDGVFSIILKLANVNFADGDYFIYIIGDGNNYFYLKSDAGKLHFYWEDNSYVHTNATTTNSFPTSGPLYLYIIGEGGSSNTAAFSTQKETSLSNIPAGNKVSGSGAWSNISQLGANYIVGYSTSGQMDAYYVVLSKLNLLA